MICKTDIKTGESKIIIDVDYIEKTSDFKNQVDKIIKLIQDSIDLYILKNRYNPNVVIIPYYMYDILKEEYENQFGKYYENNPKIFSIDIIISTDINNDIIPLRIYKNKN